MHIDGGGKIIFIAIILGSTNFELFHTVYGSIENFVIEGFISGATNRSGFLVGNNYGLISNIINNASIKGTIIYDNTETGIIINTINMLIITSTFFNDLPP